jgi:FkbH-like protein
LRSLEMRMVWGRFDKLNQPRIVQLINKTNQFNLTTTRVSDEDVAGLIADDTALTLHLRLLDAFGDNGIIAIIVGRPEADAIRLDVWLMSCRVLGRGVEEETLNLVVDEALRLGVRRLIGLYRPTAKNGMVRDHYARLGFTQTGEREGATEWTLPLDGWTPRPTYMSRERAGAASPRSG